MSTDAVETTKRDAVVTDHTPITPEKGDIVSPRDDLGVVASGSDTDEPLRGPNGEEYPSKEDLQTLRRVQGHISPIIYTIAFIELCERFAYYGTTAVCMCHLDQLVLTLKTHTKRKQLSISSSSLSHPALRQARRERSGNRALLTRGNKLRPASSLSTASGHT